MVFCLMSEGIPFEAGTVCGRSAGPADSIEGLVLIMTVS